MTTPPFQVPPSTPQLPAVTKYAKLAPPRLLDHLPRRRLFARLDALRARHPVIWIAAPPGAGKTTLAASYLAGSGAPSVWCQVDQGDADAATLFFFLAEAVKDTGPALPWNVAAMQDDSARFERLFFRDFYARLAPGTVLVFDNLQDFDWDNAGALFEHAFGEAPEGVTVLALSRDAPPPRLTRMALGGRLASIGWDEMRLDQAETLALCGPADAQDAAKQAWIALVDGWVAGLVLLQNLGGQAGQPLPPLLQGRDAVFGYFASEIFERMPARAQRTLMQLSFLPGVSEADAAELSGQPGATALLDKLYRDHLFVERRGNPVSYHFHALFRAFLQHQAGMQLAPAERNALLERGGALLERQGRIDDAAQLFQQAGAHAALCRLLLAQARDMLAAGRGQAWREWLSCLPTELAEQQPLLAYWHGASLTELTPGRARQILARAEAALQAAGDTPMRLMAIAAMIDSYDFEWGDPAALADWTVQLMQGLAALDVDALATGIDLAVHSRLTIALLFSAPDSPQLAPAAQRALDALPKVDRPSEQLAAGAILLRYFDRIDRQDSAAWLVGELQKLADDPLVSPFQRVKWYGRVAWWYNKDGNYRQAEQMTGSAKRIVASFDLDPLLFQLLEVHHLLGMGELAPARSLLDRIRGALAPQRKGELIELNALEANWRSLSGDIDGAILAARDAVRIGENEALPASDRVRFELFLAACHAVREAFEDARYWLARAASHALGVDPGLVQEAGQLIGAHALACAGENVRATALLRLCMARQRERQASTLFPMVPQLAATLAARALAQHIETDYVLRLIVTQRLPAPSRFTQNWPWPIAVRTFGKFELLRDGQPVNAAGKAQQRPLSLLKALIAAGDKGRTQHALGVQLWPAVDDAKSALNVTVHRLRKLLGDDEVIGVSAGKIELMMDRLWSDVAALGELCLRIERLAADANTGQIDALAAELLGLYRGAFCDGSDDSWILSAREQWRNRFLGAVAQLASRLEQRADWSGAATLYQRALVAEPLAEISYRNLMRCASEQGDSAAAFSAYRRCRETLSIVLGMPPSAETEQLAVALGLKPGR